MNRREFLRDICAASVAMGAPARIWGAAALAVEGLRFTVEPLDC